ncbi:MAG: PEP-CTERM sorting domain-containing protein [Pseudomonadota bacterium]
MKMKFLAAALLVAGSMSAQAATMNVDIMSVSGGSFNLGGSPGTPGSWSVAIADLTSGYQDFGSAFTFFGGPVYMFTSDGGSTPHGGSAVAGGPVPSAMVDDVAGTITVDLSAWTAHWNGTNFNQGSSSVSGTWNSVTGAYNIGWSSTVAGGPFNGQTGNWTLQGVATVAAVPEPESYAMLLAGLGLLGLVARSKAAKRG